MEVINNRRSVRNYTDQKIEKEKIEKLLRAGMQAPSAKNQQPWEFIVVEDKDSLEKLSHFHPLAKCIAGATLGIVVLCNKDYLTMPSRLQQDLGAATQNILLEAVDLDLGAVWLGTWPDEDRVAYIKDQFNLPDNIDPYSVISVGYPLIKNANKFIDRYDETRVHIEKY